MLVVAARGSGESSVWLEDGRIEKGWLEVLGGSKATHSDEVSSHSWKLHMEKIFGGEI